MILFAYLNEVGDDMICPNDITSLKTDINEMIGQKIMIKGSLGRCRTFEKEATIIGSIKSIKIRAGDDAKFAPAIIIPS